MRKKFVFFILIPVCVFIVVLYLFLDRWIESGIESAGEGLVGARVEIDNLHTSLSPLGITFSRLQVANPGDPWNNLFETGRISFSLNFGQLLRNKYIVESMEVRGLVFGTGRSTDGSLPEQRESRESSNLVTQATALLANEAKKAPVFDLAKLRRELKIDSLLSVQNFSSIRHLDTLKKQVDDANRQWQEILADVEQSKQRILEIESSAKAININELKSIETITSAITNVNTISSNINELNNTFKNRKTIVTSQISRIAAAVDTVDYLAKADYEMVRRLARLPDLSTTGMANLLVGQELLKKTARYLSYIDYARTTVPRYLPTPQQETVERMMGQEIHFPLEQSYPKWWIKKIVLSGGEDQERLAEHFYAVGEVHNASDNQRITGLPLTVALTGTKGKETSFLFNATFDRRPEVPVDTYAVDVKKIIVGDFNLGRSDFLPSKISNAVAAVTATVLVPGDRFNSNLNISFSNLTVVFSSLPKNDVERIARDVLASVTGFRVGLRLWNTGGPLDVALTTDLDDQFASRTTRVLGDELNRIQAEIRSKVNQKIAEQRAAFERLFTSKKEEALARIRTYEALVNEKLALVETKKKELEARIEQEKKKQTDTAKKKLEDAVKGLFKKQ